MKRFFGKKQVLLATLAVALGVAVYLNYYFAKQETPPINTDKSSTATTSATGGNLGDSRYVNGATTTTVNTGDSENKADVSATTAASKELPYFAQARANRENAREEALAILQELTNDVKSSQETIDDATAKILAVAQAVEQESKIENLVKAKGFADCVTYIEGANCNIVVQSEGLTAAQTLQITEIVTAQSPVLSENIKISSVNS